MNVYQKNFDLFLKIFCYVCAAWWFLDLLYVLPQPIADKVLKFVLAKLPF
ncbi:hypothetical protein UFOVP123_27 [uncultured Caudovirales phage]|uniref:Uncharacterized protein n=1 Tax=uncultured Caudovirales phage TaxID=2100421 RepID=A0A6J5LGC5_9CAUD|nr:hypothetical protein UFOVP123_27 [uncultured Caudovirales phage]